MRPEKVQNPCSNCIGAGKIGEISEADEEFKKLFKEARRSENLPEGNVSSQMTPSQMDHAGECAHQNLAQRRGLISDIKTIEKQLNDSRNFVFTINMCSRYYGIMGTPDAIKVVFDKNHVEFLIIEDKHRPNKTAAEYQVLGYALVLSDPHFLYWPIKPERENSGALPNLDQKFYAGLFLRSSEYKKRIKIATNYYQSFDKPVDNPAQLVVFDNGAFTKEIEPYVIKTMNLVELALLRRNSTAAAPMRMLS
ncbi:MAG: hypothetical protein ACP5T3_00805 [Candidatus Micrarchaeia archaeon]